MVVHVGSVEGDTAPLADRTGLAAQTDVTRPSTPALRPGPDPRSPRQVSESEVGRGRIGEPREEGEEEGNGGWGVRTGPEESRGGPPLWRGPQVGPKGPGLSLEVDAPVTAGVGVVVNLRVDPGVGESRVHAETRVHHPTLTPRRPGLGIRSRMVNRTPSGPTVTGRSHRHRVTSRHYTSSVWSHGCGHSGTCGPRTTNRKDCHRNSSRVLLHDGLPSTVAHTPVSARRVVSADVGGGYGGSSGDGTAGEDGPRVAADGRDEDETVVVAHGLVGGEGPGLVRRETGWATEVPTQPPAHSRRPPPSTHGDMGPPCLLSTPVSPGPKPFLTLSDFFVTRDSFFVKPPFWFYKSFSV